MKQARTEQQRMALSRRVERQTRHAAILAQHEAYKARVAVWTQAHDAWIAADCVGPRPVHPVFSR